MSPQPTSIFRRVPVYKHLYLYQKSEVLVLLTDVFCRRFLPLHGDRTVDQMNQAARSGKQNIVEGSEAAMTSSETEIKLINVGRASLQELREDYEDYLKKHSLQLWGKDHQGGVKERKHAARTGYRQEQDRRLRELEEENRLLKAEIASLKKQLENN